MITFISIYTVIIGLYFGATGVFLGLCAYLPTVSPSSQRIAHALSLGAFALSLLAFALYCWVGGLV